MRILQVTDLYPPFIGGMEEHVRNLSQGLAALGHEVAVATMSDGIRGGLEQDGAVRVHRLRATVQRAGRVSAPSGKPFAPPLPDPELVLGLRRITHEERPDVIHGHNWLVRSLMPLMPRMPRMPSAMVVTLHDYGVVCAKRSFLYRDTPCTGPGFSKCLHCAARHYGAARGMGITLGNWAMRPAQRASVDMFLPVSNAVAVGNELAELDLPHEVVPNFVPDDIASHANEDDPALADLPSRPFWLFVGALSRHKGLDVLLEAYAGLGEAPPLVVVGPPTADALPDWPSGAVVLPGLRHAAVMAAWRRAELAIVPSVFPDPCPTVALEAMASGVAVVGSDIGGLPDIVATGSTGLLVPPSDAAALRAALRQFVEQPDLARRMGDAGRERVAGFAASHVIRRIEAIYDRLAGAAA
jgi:glycosyltransferase involved in cell wall biosynthesis